jgi:protein involved in temperature-dependent protein secretion
MTDWVSLGGAYARGMGQHVFQIDGGEKALLEIRELTVNIQQAGADDERIG